VHLAVHYIYLVGKVYRKVEESGGKGREEEEGDRKDPTLPAKCSSISAPFCNKAPQKICLTLVFSTLSTISDLLPQAPPVLTKLKDFYLLNPTVNSQPHCT